MTRTHTINSRIARRAGLLLGLAGLAVALLAPAQGEAAAPVKFGSKLNPTVQPSNSLPGLGCGQPGACTMVQNEAYGRPDGGHRAPKSGRIKRIRVIAGGPGSFRPQIAKVRPGSPNARAKVTYTGRKLTYRGQTEANDESGSYRVESFKVNIPVKKGQQLALRGNITSMIRCSSGGDNTLIFSPALRRRAPFQGATDSDGCWILMEAVIR